MNRTITPRSVLNSAAQEVIDQLSGKKPSDDRYYVSTKHDGVPIVRDRQDKQFERQFGNKGAAYDWADKANVANATNDGIRIILADA